MYVHTDVKELTKCQNIQKCLDQKAPKIYCGNTRSSFRSHASNRCLAMCVWIFYPHGLSVCGGAGACEHLCNVHSAMQKCTNGFSTAMDRIEKCVCCSVYASFFQFRCELFCSIFISFVSCFYHIPCSTHYII